MFWHTLMVTFSATVYCQVFCDLPSIHGVCHVDENSSTRFDEQQCLFLSDLCVQSMSQMCKLLKQYKTVRPKNMHSYWRLLLLFFLYARPTYFKYSEKFRDRGKHWSVAIGMMRIMLFLLNVAIADNQVSCKRYRQVRTWVVHGCSTAFFFVCRSTFDRMSHWQALQAFQQKQILVGFRQYSHFHPFVLPASTSGSVQDFNQNFVI